MKILYWPHSHPRWVDAFLRARLDELPYNREVEDFAVIYEPDEAFSIHDKRDMNSIRPATKKEFDRYIAYPPKPVISMKRGGGMMWHGPGQACIAPFVDLSAHGLNIQKYSELLVETCIRALRGLGIEGERNEYRPGSQGVWYGGKKLAFFGFFVKGQLHKHTAIHGAMINVSPDLRPFSFIDPCNLPGVQTTSVLEILGWAPPVRSVLESMAFEFERLLEKNE